MPVDELHGQVVDLAELLGPAGRRLTERLRDEPSWRGRFGLVDRMLLGRLDTGRDPHRRSGGRGGGSSPPAARSRSTGSPTRWGWSHKHLITKFRAKTTFDEWLAQR